MKFLNFIEKASQSFTGFCHKWFVGFPLLLLTVIYSVIKLKIFFVLAIMGLAGSFMGSWALIFSLLAAFVVAFYSIEENKNCGARDLAKIISIALRNY